MSETPDVDVALVCGDARGGLDAAMASVRAQVHVRTRVTLVDTGAAAAHRRFIARRARAWGVEVVTATAGGEAAAVPPRVRYLAFLRDVDVWFPAHLSLALARLRRPGAAYVIMGCGGWGEAELGAEPPEPPADPRALVLSDLCAEAPVTTLSALVIEAGFAREALHAPPWAREADRLARLAIGWPAQGVFPRERLTLTRASPPPLGAAERLIVRQHALETFADTIRALDDAALAAFMWIHARACCDRDGVEALFAASAALAARDAWGRLQASACVAEAFRRAPARAAAWAWAPERRDAWAAQRDLRARDVAELFEAEHDAVAAARRALTPARRRWFSRSPAAAAKPAPFCSLSERIALATAAGDPYLGAGFAEREDWGRWTLGHTARLALRLEGPAGDHHLVLWPAMAFARPDAPCTVALAVNGEPPVSYEVSAPSPIVHAIPARRLGRSGIIDVRIDVARPKAADEEPRDDPRRLGLGLAAFEVGAGLSRP